jgi:hypothetical protein
MKINFIKEDQKDTLVAHIVLESLSSAFKGKKFEKFIAKYATPKGHVFDVRLMIGDTEIPLKPFVKHWQSQVESMIKEQAVKLVRARFWETSQLLNNLETQIKRQINPKFEE